MRTFAGLLALVMLGAADPAPTDYAPIIKALEAESRLDRLEGLKKAEKIGDLPEPLVRPVLAFVRRELDIATTASPRGEPLPQKPLPDALLRGDEIALARLKEKAADSIDQQFVICGWLGVGRFEVGYRNATQTHYAFDLMPVTPESEAPLEEPVRVYVSRPIGGGLADDVDRAAQRDPKARLLVRLTCTVKRFRLEGNPENVLESLEGVDWQFYDEARKSWGPAAFDGMKRGMAAVKTADRNAVAGLVEVVASNAEMPSVAIDDVLRGSAFRTLLWLSEAARGEAVAQLRKALPSAKSERARKWVVAVVGALEKTFDRAQRANGAAADGRDVSARAASAMRVGFNLEKSGKRAAAIKQYAEVMANFPDTSQAQAAAERIKALKPKR